MSNSKKWFAVVCNGKYMVKSIAHGEITLTTHCGDVMLFDTENDGIKYFNDFGYTGLGFVSFFQLP